MADLKLLPCPLPDCGSDLVGTGRLPCGVDTVCCGRCGLSVPSTDDATATERWNCRATPIAGEVELPALPKALVSIDSDDDHTWGQIHDDAWELDALVGLGLGAPLYTAEQVRQAQRDAIAPYAERIRLLERELAERTSLVEVGEMVDIGDGVDVHKGTIMCDWHENRDELPAGTKIYASIDGRTAAEAPEPAKQSTPNTDADSTHDPLYEKAVMIVRAYNRASLSLVQRNLVIGYNRSARLLEAMEANGVVSPCDEKGRRTVLAAAPTPMNSGKAEA